jgi:hypothetical protein
MNKSEQKVSRKERKVYSQSAQRTDEEFFALKGRNPAPAGSQMNRKNTHKSND